MCKCGCGSSGTCKGTQGLSFRVYVASADAADGTGFTYPADNTQAYIGFASGLANNLTPTNISLSWTWIKQALAPASYLPVAYSGTNGAILLTNSTWVDIITITNVLAGTYTASYIGNVGSLAGELQVVEVDIYNTTTTTEIAINDISGTRTVDDTMLIGVNAAKFVVAATSTIKVRMNLFTGTSNQARTNVGKFVITQCHA